MTRAALTSIPLYTSLVACALAFTPAAPHQRARPRTLPIHAQMQPGLGGMFEEAKARLWRAAQEGAGQTELDRLPSEGKPEPVVPLGDASTLPDSFEDSIRVAVDACKEALLDGPNRLVVEFDTAAGDETYNMLSRTNKFVQPFLPLFSASLAPPTADGEGVALSALPKLQVLFPDEGTAAYAKNNWQLPPNTVVGSMARAKLVEDLDALLLVNPCATEVPAVQRFITEMDEMAPDTPFVLFNPQLINMQSTGYGLVGRDLRNMVQSSFLQSFVLKSYPTGAIYRVYPEGYSVWREDAEAEGGYVLTYNAITRPSGDDIEELLIAEDADADGEGGDPFDGLAKFIKGFQSL